jgi:RNA polymerase sigma-70 factor (sigma-E family)
MPSQAGVTQPGAADRARADRPTAAVAGLYQVHAVGLIRLGVIMLGDRPAAEDVVQDAFAGLYRRWDRLTDSRRALQYVRSCVLNGCRSELRRRARGDRRTPAEPSTASAEYTALVGEEHRQVLAALRGLPSRQREALVLRFYLDLQEAEIAAAMGISRGTVKSTTSRGLATLARLLEEGSQ